MTLDKLRELFGSEPEEKYAVPAENTLYVVGKANTVALPSNVGLVEVRKRDYDLQAEKAFRNYPHMQSWTRAAPHITYGYSVITMDYKITKWFFQSNGKVLQLANTHHDLITLEARLKKENNKIIVDPQQGVGMTLIPRGHRKPVKLDEWIAFDKNRFAGFEPQQYHKLNTITALQTAPEIIHPFTQYFAARLGK